MKGESNSMKVQIWILIATLHHIFNATVTWSSNMQQIELKKTKYFPAKHFEILKLCLICLSTHSLVSQSDNTQNKDSDRQCFFVFFIVIISIFII